MRLSLRQGWSSDIWEAADAFWTALGRSSKHVLTGGNVLGLHFPSTVALECQGALLKEQDDIAGEKGRSRLPYYSSYPKNETEENKKESFPPLNSACVWNSDLRNPIDVVTLLFKARFFSRGWKVQLPARWLGDDGHHPLSDRERPRSNTCSRRRKELLALYVPELHGYEIHFSANVNVWHDLKWLIIPFKMKESCHGGHVCSPTNVCAYRQTGKNRFLPGFWLKMVRDAELEVDLPVFYFPQRLLEGPTGWREPGREADLDLGAALSQEAWPETREALACWTPPGASRWKGLAGLYLRLTAASKVQSRNAKCWLGATTAGREQMRCRNTSNCNLTCPFKPLCSFCNA